MASSVDGHLVGIGATEARGPDDRAFVSGDRGVIRASPSSWSPEINKLGAAFVNIQTADGSHPTIRPLHRSFCELWSLTNTTRPESLAKKKGKNAASKKKGRDGDEDMPDRVSQSPASRLEEALVDLDRRLSDKAKRIKWVQELLDMSNKSDDAVDPKASGVDDDDDED